MIVPVGIKRLTSFGSDKPGQMVSQHNLEWDIWVIIVKSSIRGEV